MYRLRSQEEVAQRLGISQSQVARDERSALRKLRDMPEARLLMSWVCQQNSRPITAEHRELRELGAIPESTAYLNIQGFSPNL